MRFFYKQKRHESSSYMEMRCDDEESGAERVGFIKNRGDDMNEKCTI